MHRPSFLPPFTPSTAATHRSRVFNFHDATSPTISYSSDNFPRSSSTRFLFLSCFSFLVQQSLTSIRSSSKKKLISFIVKQIIASISRQTLDGYRVISIDHRPESRRRRPSRRRRNIGRKITKREIFFPLFFIAYDPEIFNSEGKRKTRSARDRVGFSWDLTTREIPAGRGKARKTKG